MARTQDEILIQVPVAQAEEFQQSISALADALRTISPATPDFSVPEPTTSRGFGGEMLSEFVIPLIPEIGAVLSAILGYWMKAGRVSITVGDVTIKDARVKDLDKIMSTVDRLIEAQKKSK